MSAFFSSLRARFRGLVIAVGAVRIRTKILGIIVFLTLLLGSSVAVQVRSQLKETLRAHLKEECLQVSRVLAARASDLILTGDYYALHGLLRDIQANNSDVEYLFVLDREDRLLAHTYAGGFPRGLIEANTAGRGISQSVVFLKTTEGRVWDAACPILDGREGWVRAGISERTLEIALARTTRRITLTTLLVALLGVGVATGLTWVLTSPILDLVRASRAVIGGDLSQRARFWARDEVGLLAKSFNAMVDRLVVARGERLERDRLRVRVMEDVIQAQEDERKRLSRELHDQTGQSLTSLLIGLRDLQIHTVDPGVAKRAEMLRKITTDTLSEVRDLALRLRPRILDDMGLVAALESHVLEYGRSNRLQVDLATQGMGRSRLPGPIETALYRIVQEGITNVVRHAGARTASVFLEQRAEDISVIVEDDGCGFDVRRAFQRSDRMGLSGIRERVHLLGGSFQIESQPGSGTCLRINVPLTHPQSWDPKV